MQASSNLTIPFADQYLGVWAILEEHASALLHQAQNINIQLHMEQAATPEAQAEIAARASTELQVTRDGIAVVELRGSLTKHASSMSSNSSMVAARRQIRAAMNDPDIAGIFLHIDSPGGTVAGTIDLGDDVAAAAKKKPVYAYIEDLGASAAYWIASQATKVYANRGARVGSIGVFAVVPDFKQMADKEGIVVHVLRFGAMKGAGVEGTAITEEQLAEWQKSVNNFGAQFVDAIAAGRGMTKTMAEQLADGRVHDASGAMELRLIDGVQTIEATMAGLIAAGKPTPSTRTKAMSETTDAPKAATHKEIKAALPKASADFILAQLEAEATLDKAVLAYSAHLESELAKEKTAREEAEAKAAKNAPTAAPAKKTAEGLGAGNLQASDVEGDVATLWEEAIEAEIKAGKSRPQAVIAVGRKQPELRKALVAAANSHAA